MNANDIHKLHRLKNYFCFTKNIKISAELFVRLESLDLPNDFFDITSQPVKPWKPFNVDDISSPSASYVASYIIIAIIITFTCSK